MKELNKKADENHNKNLLKNYGFLPWRRLIKNREKIMKNADDFYKKNLLKTEFFKWMLHTRNECERRSQLADKMCKTSLLRLGWQSLKKVIAMSCLKNKTLDVDVVFWEIFIASTVTICLKLTKWLQIFQELTL